jgi:hypothetical protein
LVVSAVVVALASASQLTARRATVGLGVAVVGAACAVLGYRASVVLPGRDWPMFHLIEPLAAGVLILACVLLAGTGHRLGWSAAGLTILPAAGVGLVFYGSEPVSSSAALLVQFVFAHASVLQPSSFTVAGVFTGVVLALAMTALARPFPAVAVAAPEPTPPPVPPAPAAASGVPEFLQLP